MREKRPRGFFGRMLEEELIKYITENHSGKTLTELSTSRDGQAYDVARKRGLVDRLVEQGILVREQRENGFFKNMSDETLIDFVKTNHSGESIVEFQKGQDKTAYQTALQRKLIKRLVEEGVLKRTVRPSGFFSNMSDDELINYIEENHGGKTTSQFQHGKDGAAYNTARKRGLMNRLVEQGILVVNRRINFFDNMSDDGLIKYIEENHGGDVISEFSKGKDSQAYKQVCNRGLMNRLVEQGILIRRRRPNNFFKGLSDDELVNFIKGKYSGKSISHLSVSADRYAYTLALKRGLIDDMISKGILTKSERRYEISVMDDASLLDYVAEHHKGVTVSQLQIEDGSLYNIVRERGLIDRLVDNGVLKRARKKSGFFSTMSNEELVAYAKERFKGMRIHEFQKNKQTNRLYKVAHQRGLVDVLVKNGVLVRTRKKNGFYTDMNDDELIIYIQKGYQGKTLSELNYSKDGQAYDVALRRGLLDVLVERGILIRATNQTRTTKQQGESLLEGWVNG